MSSVASSSLLGKSVLGASACWSRTLLLAFFQARLAATRPGCLRERSLKRRTPVWSDNPSCLGEEVSPKREGATAPLFLISSPRLGEGSSLERGKPLA
ncbi:hypothetical protein DEO72_LG5g2169 [Vigna unguiculata]|uniref:Uncharacterized protein n=1 Tax=Vigna unguiculata TaxID=3917 RepID=A0A4D6LZS7_VIGUN|nr:hypothetical protein DEO72_LG5g2169 [Vigna unguiculata]